MANKRLFEILDQMNIQDTENGTMNIQLCPNFVSADYSKKINGTKVTMGIPGNIVFDLETDKLIPVLLLVNREEYDKLQSENK